jgi:hypothetical protein
LPIPRGIKNIIDMLFHYVIFVGCEKTFDLV